MQIKENEAMVVISIPRFCVPVDKAQLFVRTANEFWADTMEEMLRIYQSKRFEFDNKYIKGEFIPTIEEVNSYSDVLNKKVDVEQLDKYIKLEPDEKYGKNDEIYNLWYPDKEQDEYDENEE